MDDSLKRALEARLATRILAVTPLSGGDINDAYRLELFGREPVFLKTNARAPSGLFEAEARGLDWLRAAAALRVPRVVLVSGPEDSARFLVLEFLAAGRPRRAFDEQLGRGLAALHASGAPHFGLDHPNFIGSLPQENSELPSWSEFYRARRLQPLLERASASGRVGLALRRSFDRLFARLDELVGPAEPPRRLHGDLWGGNLHVAENGEPCLIDPAVYGGHREVDLAMMRLFGGFSERVFEAYAEAFPLSAGAAERVALYQLYPLLVHVNLFGGSYVGSLERGLRAYV